ncbi:16179_t:CDS:2, partial [Racocetra persica]
SSYPNLKHLNLWDNRMITDEGLCQIAQSCNKLEYLNISYCNGIRGSRGKIKDASILLQMHLKLEYLDFAHVIAFQNNFLIVAIIRSSPNLKYFDIFGNDIGDEVVEAHLELGFCDISDKTIKEIA